MKNTPYFNARSEINSCLIKIQCCYFSLICQSGKCFIFKLNKNQFFLRCIIFLFHQLFHEISIFWRNQILNTVNVMLSQCLTLRFFDLQVCITIFDFMLALQAWNGRTSKVVDYIQKKLII